jgi:hypothetical protein
VSPVVVKKSIRNAIQAGTSRSILLALGFQEIQMSKTFSSNKSQTEDRKKKKLSRKGSRNARSGTKNRTERKTKAKLDGLIP